MLEFTYSKTMLESERKLNKVKQLIALATGGATEEEARTSAFIAVKLISSEKFEIVLPSRVWSAPPIRPQYRSRPRPKSAKDYFENIPANANNKAQRFVECLKILLKDRPGTVCSVSWMIKMALATRVIKASEATKFEKEIRSALKMHNFKSKRGRLGGYYL